MDATQSASKEPSTPKALAQDKPSESASVDAPTNLQSQFEIKPDVCYAIPGELLRALVDQKRKPSRISAILNHPLTVVVISGGLIGGWLANYYTNRQKDFEHQ